MVKYTIAVGVADHTHLKNLSMSTRLLLLNIFIHRNNHTLVNDGGMANIHIRGGGGAPINRFCAFLESA